MSKSLIITCKLTGEMGKGVKSHIIPRSFYEIEPQENGSIELMTNKKGEYNKRAPIGIYDQDIFIEKGEKLFDKLDSFGAELLINNFDSFKEINDSNNSLIAWSIQDYSYQTIKLFVLSVIWRAHTSKQSFFSRVDLGIHADKIKSMLLDSNPGDENQYSVNIVRWKSNDFGAMFMDPARVRFDEINYYQLYCGRYVFYIKIDKRESSKKLKKTQLTDGQDFLVVARDLEESKEFSAMRKIAILKSKQQ